LKDKKSKPKRSLFRKIINAFIGVFGFIIFILLLFLGFSQTKTFRDYLKEKIQEEYSSSFNGQLQFGNIEGSIFTSLIINDISIVNEKDTIISIDELSVNINPFELFKRQLSVPEIKLDKINFYLLETEPGLWNLDNLLKIDSTSLNEKEEIDSLQKLESTLPFSVVFSHLKILNSNIVIKNFQHLNSDTIYRYINYDDLELNNFNLDAVLNANLKKNLFEIEIRNLSASLNTQYFGIKQLKGNFLISNSGAAVSGFKLKTKLSDIQIDAKLDSVNLFDTINLTDFKNYPVKLKLKAEPFDFDDLSTFEESTDILKGKPKVDLTANGKFGDLDIEKLNIVLNSTEINAKGKVTKLDTPEDLFLDINIINSTINESDAVRLLPELGIPDYNEFTLKNINIKFKGEPTNFYTKLGAEAGKGKINIEGRLDVSQPELVYDLKFSTQKLNVEKILDISSILNSRGKVKGRGIDPQVLKANIDISLSNSLFGSFVIDTLDLSSTADAKKIELDLYSMFNNTEGEIRGNIDFVNNNLPAYNLTGNLSGLNLNDFTDIKKYETDLNFSFVAGGFELDPDNMTGNFFIEMRESKFANKDINDSRLTLFLTKSGSHRSIKLNSDFIDLAFEGDFKLSSAIKVLSAQSSQISKIIENKLYELNPANLQYSQLPYPEIEIDKNTLDDLEINFNFRFKDFELISLLLDTKEFDISGTGRGTILNDENNFAINSEIILDYLLNADKDNPIFLSNINSDIHFTRNNKSVTFDDLFGSVSISGNKVILQNEIKDVIADIAFNGSTILFNSSLTYDNLFNSYIDGEIELVSGAELFTLYEFEVNYKGIQFNNKEDITFKLSDNDFDINNLSLISDNSIIDIYGSLNKNGAMNFNLTLSGMKGNTLSQLILGKRDNDIKSVIAINSKLTGTLNNPVITSNLVVDSVGYSNSLFGRLNGDILIKNNNAKINFVFNDLENNTNDTLLTLTGNIPVEISNEIKKKKSGFANFNLRTNNFNLAALGNLIPYTKNISGILTADVTVRGDIENLVYGGSVSVKNGYFNFSENNLGYNYSIDLKFDKNKVHINKIKLENADRTNYPGTFTASGSAVLKGFDLEEVVLNAEGNLAVLSEATKEVNPNFYGDLVLKTEGSWEYIYRDGKSEFNGNILLTKADLTLSPSGQTEINSSDKIIYSIKSDSSLIDREEKKFLEIITERKNIADIEIEKSNFDYNFNVKIEDEAKIQFLLSKIWNQKLSVLAKGELKYESINNVSRAQGALELQPGSKLEFVKTFDATGNIKFESDITNPYLDVTAIYSGSYNQGTDELPDIIDVQVEMKLTGTLDKLGTNLMQNPENIAIFKGSRNIENKIRDNRYDISDAILFIYIGRFKEDLTANDKSRLAGLGNTATSFLGSALTSIINSAVGDVVSDIQVDQTGQDTKIIISGRYQNIRYSVGGTTRIQNISEANLKLEYQLLPNLLFRLERKDPIVRSFGVDEKISELGLKYRIQF